MFKFTSSDINHPRLSATLILLCVYLCTTALSFTFCSSNIPYKSPFSHPSYDVCLVMPSLSFPHGSNSSMNPFSAFLVPLPLPFGRDVSIACDVIIIISFYIRHFSTGTHGPLCENKNARSVVNAN